MPAFQCRARSLPIWLMMTAALLVLADLGAVRMGAWRAFCALIHASFHHVLHFQGSAEWALLRIWRALRPVSTTPEKKWISGRRHPKGAGGIRLMPDLRELFRRTTRPSTAVMPSENIWGALS